MHYAALRQPVDPTAFITGLKQRLTDALTRLDQALVDGTAGGVKVTSRRGEPWISVPKLTALPEPQHLQAVKDEVVRRELTGPDREYAEVSMPALHLLQSALMHITTLLLQAVLEQPAFHESLDDIDRRAFSPLFWSHQPIRAVPTRHGQPDRPHRGQRGVQTRRG